MRFNIRCITLLTALLIISISSFASRFRPGPGGGVLGTLTGTVTDKADGKSIIGATVSIPDLKKATATDINGHYSLENLPRGVYLVQVSYLGYATFNQRVDFTKTTTLDVQLRASSIETGEVVITGVSKATEIRRDPVPMAAVSKAFIDQHSASGNVIDEIANVPGVSAVTTGPNISKPFIHGLGYNRVITCLLYTSPSPRDRQKS